MTPADRFPAAAGLRWAPVAGGLSGARVWRGDDAGGVPRAALKCLPAGFPAEKLRRVHGWMAAAGSPLVPAAFRAPDGDTVAEADGGMWECVGWGRGLPLLVDNGGSKPTPGRGWALGGGPPLAPVQAACSALAALHRGWSALAQPAAPPPCIARRRELFAAVAPHLACPPAYLRPAADFLRHALPSAHTALVPFDAPGPVHPCLCDPRPEHFLFTGDTLTGVIDYAAMKPDHPAVDLARLLMETGYLPEGVAAYHAAGGSPAVTPELVQVLADTGRIGAIANWVLRLAGREPTAAEVDRLERLLAGVVH